MRVHCMLLCYLLCFFFLGDSSRVQVFVSLSYKTIPHALSSRGLGLVVMIQVECILLQRLYFVCVQCLKHLACL